MDLREQYKKETGLNIKNRNNREYSAKYVKWLEHRLSTIVQQSLSCSDDKSSSPKSPQNIVFGGWHLCKKCSRPVINGKKCKNCGDF